MAGGRRDPQWQHDERGDAARASERAGGGAPGVARARAGGDRRRHGGRARLGGHALRGPRGDLPPGRRALDHAPPRIRQRDLHARSEQDDPSVGDRRGLRAGRLLALQRAFPGAHPQRAAHLAARLVEPHGSPAAGGFRLRGHALQLPLDRREPADGAGPGRQRGGVEAGSTTSAPRLLGDHASSCARRGCPTGVLSFVPGAGPEQGAAALDSEHLAGHPLHRHARGPSARSGRASRERLERYRAYPAHRRRDGRQGLHRRAPERRRRRRSPRPSVRGGFEYQGQKCSAVEPRLHPEVALAGGSRRRRGRYEEHEVRRRHRLHELRRRGDRRARLRQDHRLHRRSRKETATDRPRRRAATRREGYFMQPTLVQVDDPSTG